jgi:hypothetical protein
LPHCDTSGEQKIELGQNPLVEIVAENLMDRFQDGAKAIVVIPFLNL